MTYTSNFADVLHNGYTNTSRSLLEAETVKSINNDLGNASNAINLPKCHLNFGNIGDMDFDFMDFSAKPVNLKIFEKIEKISYTIRKTNKTMISLINELKCCDVADLYNETVIPILEWVLQDFIKIIID